ncbi:hypothetical protein NARC_30132 [Candidatus Nitrosocosmicus arcticus]|uniref:Uncharacterized protein n=1 Tax=Candidatus Nitrosocosmicus arcticus TaxID=2035267 RepID=A0A557SXT6_9ARCH|nr:hypothetical protein NARC_30132 [Candidatus Nitrosocosmicus arcticus]
MEFHVHLLVSIGMRYSFIISAFEKNVSIEILIAINYNQGIFLHNMIAIYNNLQLVFRFCKLSSLLYFY